MFVHKFIRLDQTFMLLVRAVLYAICGVYQESLESIRMHVSSHNSFRKLFWPSVMCKNQKANVDIYFALSYFNKNNFFFHQNDSTNRKQISAVIEWLRKVSFEAFTINFLQIQFLSSWFMFSYIFNYHLACANKRRICCVDIRKHPEGQDQFHD